MCWGFRGISVIRWGGSGIHCAQSAGGGGKKKVNEIIHADVLEGLSQLPDNSVQCCVTSPPYWGLRDYGTARWEGGDPACQHVFKRKDERLMLGSNGKLGKNCTSWTHRDAMPPRICSCGAVRIDNQIGLEPTPEAYVAKMVAVFREVRRVLRPDAVCFINLGDSYNGSGGAGGDYSKGGLKEGQPKYPGRKVATLKPKDLVGIPWRVAFALQSEGWYLRQDIIWAKPNPMPESVTDRCTKSHEYIFLLTKSAKYYYDNEAVKEPKKEKIELLRE